MNKIFKFLIMILFVGCVDNVTECEYFGTVKKVPACGGRYAICRVEFENGKMINVDGVIGGGEKVYKMMHNTSPQGMKPEYLCDRWGYKKINEKL